MIKKEFFDANTDTDAAHYHFIGIGGIGMSALAHIVLERGSSVSGSDIAAGAEVVRLKNRGAQIFSSHSAAYIHPEMTVVYNSAIAQGNSELSAAKELGCRLLHRSELLAELMQGKKVLSVTGTHGKTTTTSLLSWVFHSAGSDPSFAIGGVVPQLGGNSRQGSGAYFLAEADESDGTFLRYPSIGAIITNIDCDHMEFFQTPQRLCEAFRAFAGNVVDPSLLFFCGDDDRLAACCGGRGVSYGFTEGCELRITGWQQIGWNSLFTIDWQGRRYEQILVALAGRHNVSNAAAVFGLALAAGLDESAIRSALASFGGVARRCHKLGQCRGIQLIDDYAHHPAAVSATLQAIRDAIGERRMVLLFQPHRFSRTKETLGQWGKVFDCADQFFISEIYSAGELATDITHCAIIDEVSAASSVPCRALAREDAPAFLARFCRPHDVLVTMGAGDVTAVGKEILEIWKDAPPAPLKVGVVSGGQSGEHSIALASAAHILEGLKQEHYEVSLFGISRQGNWVYGDRAVALFSGAPLLEPAARFEAGVLTQLEQCELIIPVLHGPFGEDGTVQGLFELLNIPYVGCDQRASALCMDKIVTKRLAHACGIPILPFVEVTWQRWHTHQAEICRQAAEELTFPLFVKPAHLGSTLGVFKVSDSSALAAAVDAALRFDHIVLIEQGVVGGRELEFALIGNEVVIAFPPGEIFTGGELYDYQAKYGAGGFKTTCYPTGLDAEQLERGKAFAIEIYRAARCNGLTRVDFFLDAHGQWWLNELNPLPGFTAISLYPQICAANALPIDALVDTLSALALHRHAMRQRLVV